MILDLIEILPDPRMVGKVKHDLSTIIFTTLCDILSGCKSWLDIEDYCQVKRNWLEEYVFFLHSVPSAWTFRRVFTLLDPDKLEDLLRTHASSIVASQQASDHIAVDGKSLRGSRRRGPLSSVCHGLVHSGVQKIPQPTLASFHTPHPLDLSTLFWDGLKYYRTVG